MELNKEHSAWNSTAGSAIIYIRKITCLCDHCSKYFVDKIKTIPSKFPDKVHDILSVQKPEIRSKINVFERATEDEIKSLF